MPLQPAASAARDGRFDMRDVWRHLGPDRHFGGAHHPAADFFENLRILAHCRAHPPLGQAVGAGKIALETIDARLLAALDDLDPRLLAIFLHDRGDQHAVGMPVLDLFEFVEPDVEGPIADQLDILPADDFFRLGGAESGISRLHVGHFRRIETDRLADHGAPAFVERLADDVGVRARRAGRDDQGIGEF